MKLKTPLLPLALLTLLTTAAAQAQDKQVTLKVGDPAPKLRVASWVQGEPLKELETGKAYIVEFWATWCGPCRATIPHLNKIHNKFKDRGLIVIGQDVFERDLSAVPAFVKQMGENMTYRVAMDDTSVDGGAMATTWMEAAGRNGIPAAFVVEKHGRIAWIGHPMELEEQLLEKVLAGTLDVEKLAATYELQVKNKTQLETLRRKLNMAVRAKEWADAEITVADIEKLLPEDERDSLMPTRLRLYFGKGDSATAQKMARQLSAAQPDNAIVQNDLAWTIATTEGVDKSDLELAETFALRANELTKGKDPAVLDTLARVYWLEGKKNKALGTQQQAIDTAEGRAKNEYRKVLASYKEGKLPPVK